MVSLDESSPYNDGYCIWGNGPTLQIFWQQSHFKGMEEQKVILNILSRWKIHATELHQDRKWWFIPDNKKRTYVISLEAQCIF